MSGPTIERSELIVLACKAGASIGRWGDAVFTRAELKAFYRLAYAAGQDAEREACAKVADAESSIEGIAQRIASAIRARGQQ